MIDREFIVGILEKAKENLNDHGELLPVGFMIIGDAIVVMPTQMSEDKYEGLFICGGTARIAKAEYLITLNDAAARHFSSPEQAQYMLDNPETEAPLTYPKSMRQECVIAQVIDFSTREASVVMMPYSGDHPNFKFEEPTEMIKCQGALANSVLKGWDVAELGIRRGELHEKGLSELDRE